MTKRLYDDIYPEITHTHTHLLLQHVMHNR